MFANFRRIDSFVSPPQLSLWLCLSFILFLVLLKVMNSVTWTVYVEIYFNPDDCQRPSISSQNSDHSLLDLTKLLSNVVWNCSWVTQLVDAVVSCISNFTSAKPQWNCSFGYHLDGALMLPFRGCQRKRAAKMGHLVWVVWCSDEKAGESLLFCLRSAQERIRKSPTGW